MPRKVLPLKEGMDWEKFFNRLGIGKKDFGFWKELGRAMLITYAIGGAAYIWDETSPLGWWNLKPRPKMERDMAHLYERRIFPYPGDTEAMEEFIAKGGMIGTTIGPKGMLETDPDTANIQRSLHNKVMQQESQKLWTRMRNEVLTELQEKGYDIE